MANRCLLHISKLEDFSDWLQKDGWELKDTKGLYEVLRAVKNRRWLIVYRRAILKEHYTVQDKDTKVLRAYYNSKKGN